MVKWHVVDVHITPLEERQHTSHQNIKRIPNSHDYLWQDFSHVCDTLILATFSFQNLLGFIWNLNGFWTFSLGLGHSWIFSKWSQPSSSCQNPAKYLKYSNPNSNHFQKPFSFIWEFRALPWVVKQPIVWMLRKFSNNSQKSLGPYLVPISKNIPWSSSIILQNNSFQFLVRLNLCEGSVC